MGRFTLALLCLFCVLSGSALAGTADISVRGQWDFAFGHLGNSGFTKARHQDASDEENGSFEAIQRVRTQINCTISEYVQSVLMFEIGNLYCGRGIEDVGRGSGGAIDADGVNIETKRAYVDWIAPGTDTSIRMGIQGLSLPATPMGSTVFDADVAGIVAASPISKYWHASVFWIRPFSGDTNDGMRSDKADFFGMVLRGETGAITVSPWCMYGLVGGNSGYYSYEFERLRSYGDDPGGRAKAWWAASHMVWQISDVLTGNLEAVYGRLGRAGKGLERPGTSGWYVGTTLDWKTDWGTPGLLGWWASGDDSRAARTGKLGRMPILGNNHGSFGPTHFGTAGGLWGIPPDGAVSGTGTGTWGIGAQIKDVSFVPGLTHVLRVAYYRGTNSPELADKSRSGDIRYLRYAPDCLYLTREDAVLEVNFDHKLAIYENLTAALELGYLHLTTGEAWKHTGNEGRKKDNAWKAMLLLRYRF